MLLPQSATRRSDCFVTLTLTTAPTAARAEPGPGIDQFRLGRRGWMNRLNWERWGLPVTTPPPPVPQCALDLEVKAWIISLFCEL